MQLVIQAGAVGRDGEALVLDMGEPVRIADVARRLVAEADRPVEIVYTGLRPGEKLHEVLLGADEADDRPAHPLISHVPVPPLHVRASWPPSPPTTATTRPPSPSSGAWPSTTVQPVSRGVRESSTLSRWPHARCGCSG